MRKHEITLSIYLPHLRPDHPEDAPEEIDVTVQYNYMPGFPGSYWEPAHGPEIDVLSAKLADGTDAPGDIYQHIQTDELCIEQMVKQCCQ